jgi:hypothetical protein
MSAIPLTPAVATAVVGLVTWLSPEIPKWKKWLVISLTIISVGAIGINSWWGEHQKSVQETSHAEAIKVISSFSDEASAIQQDFINTDDAGAIRVQYEQWFATTNKMLTEKLDSSYAVSFRSAPSVLLMPVNHSMVGARCWSALEGKKVVLSNMMTGLRQRQ